MQGKGQYIFPPIQFYFDHWLFAVALADIKSTLISSSTDVPRMSGPSVVDSDDSIIVLASRRRLFASLSCHHDNL